MPALLPRACRTFGRAALGAALSSSVAIGVTAGAAAPAFGTPLAPPSAMLPPPIALAALPAAVPALPAPPPAGPAAPLTVWATVPAAVMGVPASVRAWPILRLGDRGSAVQYLQRRLGLPGVGIFGPHTHQAVRRFEARHRLHVNGIAGHSVWSALGVSRVVSRGVGSPGSTSWGRAVLAEAVKHRGKPYRWGGSGPSSFDCSGFVQYAIRRATGRLLPRTSASMYTATTRLTRSQLRAGDLVFVRRSGHVSHVAIYDGQGRWWEATRPGRLLGLHAPWTSSVAYGRVR